MTHYDTYPYPDPQQLTAVTSLRKWRTDAGPREDTWKDWFPGERYGQRRKRMLVAGCGTTEAVLIAAQEPMLDVVGIDESTAAIRIADRMAEAEGLSNLKLTLGSLLDDIPLGPFDAASCSGVLHHIPTVELAVRKLRLACRHKARMVAMVYGDVMRSHVPQFCDALKKLGIKPDVQGIAAARRIIEALPEHHPVREVPAAAYASDAQFVDMWLHPYFKQYAADEFVGLMWMAGPFRVLGWMGPAVADVPGMTIPDDPAGWRVRQVINCADPKLTAMFEAA